MESVRKLSFEIASENFPFEEIKTRKKPEKKFCCFVISLVREEKVLHVLSCASRRLVKNLLAADDESQSRHFGR